MREFKSTPHKMEPPKKKRKTEEKRSMESNLRRAIMSSKYPASPLYLCGKNYSEKYSDYPTYTLYFAWTFIGLVHYNDYMHVTSSSELENSLYRMCRSKHKQNKEVLMIDISNYIKRLAATLLPGPPHWGGREGGCLGLPKDVAKMILKWL